MDKALAKGGLQLDPFNGKNPFEHTGPMSQNPFSTDYLEQIKEMIDQYNAVLTDDFWRSIHGLKNQQRKTNT